LKTLVHHESLEEVPADWCNADLITTSIMEAVSFVTPVLESYFIRTVVEGSRTHQDAELAKRCKAFVREESNHSRVHKKFNSLLLCRLGKQPPALALVIFLLDRASRWLSISKRLEIAAGLEHLSTVISKLYVQQQSQLSFASNFAQNMFDKHAQEELAHRSVVYDLWLTFEEGGLVGRIVTIFLIVIAGAIYLTLAVLWLSYQKTGKKLVTTLFNLIGFMLKNFRDTLTHTPIVELLMFVRRDYHPDTLVDDDLIKKK
jgi:predicted metal-dependent hydrolase